MEMENVIEIDVEAEQGGRQGLSAYEIYLNNGGTLSETEWLESLKGEAGADYVITPDDYNEISNEVVIYIQPTIDEVVETSGRAETIAKGRATGYVFDTVEELDVWLQNVENTSKLIVGDNLYIRAIGIPDYWWDGSAKQELETQKIDLLEYPTKEEVEAITGELVNLSTENKSNLVDAINEVLANEENGSNKGIPSLSGNIDPSTLEIPQGKYSSFYAAEDVIISVANIGDYTFPKGVIFYLKRNSASRFLYSGTAYYNLDEFNTTGFQITNGVGRENTYSFSSKTYVDNTIKNAIGTALESEY